MPSVGQLRSRLLRKLKELFQLDQPDLDFGFYRIMHAKAQQVSEFIEKDLLKIVNDAFGQMDDTCKAELQSAYEKAIETAKGYGAPVPENVHMVMEAQARLEAIKDTVSAEADIYDHLYRFFERYYDDGDFISRRYYTRETSGKAAPFAVPYNGEEVKLHWANADQYYIKTAEHFSNFTFDLRQSREVREQKQIGMFVPDGDQSPLHVHFRIVEAVEGEHGNVKESEANKRFFIIHAEKPVEFSANGELVVNFEYRPDPEKSGQEGSWRDKRNAEAIEIVLKELERLTTEYTESTEGKKGTEKQDMNSVSSVPSVVIEYFHLLKVAAPTESDKKRALLAKYINQYTARNTMDYFIHKDLGRFLHRELDFYIKNEVMRLDDIENADAPAVESYLAKIKVLRKIAGKLIDFLAQLEDFQKKLWLKKKFVLETNYCITLDRVPEDLYPEIAANQAQHDEWVRLFAIDEIKQVIHSPDYSMPLTEDFLKANNKLVLDTRFSDDAFNARLIASIEDFDEQCDGLLIHSENFQALNLLQERYRAQVKCVHIDPPYNTATSGFLYKNQYQHSSWLSLMQNRLYSSLQFLMPQSVFACHIDEYEMERLHIFMEGDFLDNAGTMVWDKGMPIAGANGLATQHEYVLFRTKGNAKIRVKKKNVELIHSQIKTLLNKYGTPTKEAISEYRKWLRSQPQLSKSEKTYDQFDDAGRAFRSDNMSATDRRANEKFYIPLSHPITNKECPVPEYGWRYAPESINILIENKLVLFGDDHLTMPRKKTYLEDTSDSQMATIFRSGSRGKGGLDNLNLKFPFAHAIDFYSYIIDASASAKDLILDYFAGSGTTGHAVINLNREDSGNRKYILVEMGDYFDTVLKPRIAKVVYSESWKDGKPTARHTGISHCFKYLRLESYEDTLNNLRFDENPIRSKAISSNTSLKEDFMLHYLLDVETRGSQSLLNIDDFTDPTAYTLKVKKPGSDENTVQHIDLMETFNYLIGLRVVHTAAAQTFTAAFKRIEDPEVPKKQKTKLVIDGKIKQIKTMEQTENPGEETSNSVPSVPSPPSIPSIPSVPSVPSVVKNFWWFRKIEGWVPKDTSNPGNGQREKVLIVWRKLTGDMEHDNLMLDEWFQENRISTRDFEFDIIYVNGSNNLPNLALPEDKWKVRLIEEEFMKRMWEAGK